MRNLVLGFLAITLLGSCNTMIGLGRDMRQMGEGMENWAHGRKFDGSDQQQQENLPVY